MDYDDFDYLDLNLADWTDQFIKTDWNSPNQVLNAEHLRLIQDEYVPRLERAIHMLHSTNSSAWTHPYVEAQPFVVVTADEEIQDMISEGGNVS